MEGSSHWNPCPVGGDNKSNADDVGFVEAIINDITNQYNIDIDRHLCYRIFKRRNDGLWTCKL